MYRVGEYYKIKSRQMKYFKLLILKGGAVIMNKIDSDLLLKAYKKLKSSVYFDKTNLILRDKIVDFESSIEDLEDYFKRLAKIINHKKNFKKLEKEIIDSISILSFPKNLKGRNRIQNSDKESVFITNSGLKKLEIADVQHFIDMDVMGHILGVLWLMSIGYRIDEKLYAHSYGNRIRENLYNEFSNEPTYSPYLFQPYFEQYESWRDNAMEKALEHLKKGQDVIILTLDFKRYYYSVDMNKDAFNAMYDEAFKDNDEEKNSEINKELNRFIYLVVEKYSSKFNTNRNILPIGFLPSNILGNWFLNSFDNAIVDGWNPVYFGRYVDDVLIVDKVEHNGVIHKKIQDDNLSVEEIINYYLIQCSKWSGLQGDFQCKNSKENGLFIEDSDSECKIYKINKKYLVPENNNSEICLQKNKLRVFYFKSSETDALITCFRNNISKNKSEFRYMPEDVAVFQRDDYSKIYHLQTNESPNKFRGINGILLDKYELSKFLGKHLRIGGLIEDVVESKFEKDIGIIFNDKVTIENYLSWEKIIEIFVINERFETAKKFIFGILNSIDKLTYNDEDRVVTIEKIKRSLYLHLYSAVNRVFALVWKDKSSKILKEIYDKLKEFKIDVEDINKKRINYCKTRMIDKYVMPVPIDMFDIESIVHSNKKINLTHFYEVLSVTKGKFESNYIYYPYLITMYDFSIISAIEQFHSNYENLEKVYKTQNERYVRCNYKRTEDKETSIKIDAMNSIGENIYGISVGDFRKDRLSIAIANVKLNHKNFEKLIKGKPDRSYERYKDVSILVNNAINEKVDMLIMPESFIPFEWLPTLARTCAKNSLAIVTGVEHILFDGKAFNLTAVILPYKEVEHRCASISFHLKTHYAPNEKSEIRGYNLKEIEGKTYELYKWNGCYFPVYCCYELTSIKDRALFQSYADFLIAIEWNRDVNYYSNILESLSRDIHCYCIQVNSSDYGDSRITKPSKTEEKDIIRTKGGKNSTILVETIDISALRDFQIKSYELQKSNYRFKTTPPNFESEIVMKKIKGENIINI